MYNIRKKLNDILKNGYNSEYKTKAFGETFTDFELIDKIIDREINEKDFRSPYTTFLDPSAGIGNFHCVILERLMENLKEWEPNEEKRYKHIIENQLFFIEFNEESCNIIEEVFNPYGKFHMNIKNCNALELDIKNMKFEDWKNNKTEKKYDVLSNFFY